MHCTYIRMSEVLAPLTDSNRIKFEKASSYLVFVGFSDYSSIYNDPKTGEFYVDDGFQVKIFGRPGESPHPIHRERLMNFLEKHSPRKVRWADLYLAMYCDKIDALWVDLNIRYVEPKQPKKPLWGRGIRKERWMKYDLEVMQYEQKLVNAREELRKECDYWNTKIIEYNQCHKNSKKQKPTIHYEKEFKKGPSFHGEQLTARIVPVAI